MKARVRLRVWLAAFTGLIAMSSMTLAQGLPGSGDSSLGSGFDFSNYYVGAGVCSSSCFRLAAATSTPTWSVETRNPWGSQTHYENGVVLWDEDNDGDEEPVNMESYRIEADVVAAVSTSDGKVHVVIELTVINQDTQEVVNSESIVKTYEQSTMTGQ